MAKKIRSKLTDLISLLAVVVVISCTPKADRQLAITPQPIDAVVEGDLLIGPSVLHDPDRFVWGGKVTCSL